MYSKRVKKKAYIIQNRDLEILKQSTAGGAFSAIAEYVLLKGGIVFGVEMTQDFEVVHTSVEKVDELYKYRNSKYVQSNLGDSYKHIKAELEKGRLVCFSGTPCQVEGLICFLQKPYENLILVDVVCRAVPSPGVWREYIKMEQKRLERIESIRFRDKTLGYQYSTMELKMSSGKIIRGGIESQPWLRLFFSGMIIRPSCADCRFRSYDRKSDFTIWDCFNIYSISKRFNEDVGTTRMLIHSDKGMEIFENIKEKLTCEEIPFDLAVAGVKEMRESPQLHEKRDSFYSDYNSLGIESAISKYFPITFKIRIKKYSRILLNAVGLDKTLKHILKKG